MFNQTKKPRLSYGIAEDRGVIDDVLPLIAEKLSSIESYDSFASVCRSWRAAVNSEKRKHKSLEHPHLMLLEPDQQGVWRISSGKSREIFVPEAIGKRCLSWGDWLFIVSKDGSHPSLLHPVSGVQIHLPELPAPVNKVVLSANPTTTCYLDQKTNTTCYHFGAAVMLDDPELGIFILEPGGSCWDEIDTGYDEISTGYDQCLVEVSDIIYFNGRIYAVDYKGRVGIGRNGDFHEICRFPTGRVTFQKFCLVEVSHKLFVVRRDFAYNGKHYVTKEFQIYQVYLKDNPEEKTVTKPVMATKDFLGNKALFLSYDSYFLVECADYNHCKPNCIYFVECNMSYYYLSGYSRVLGKPGNDKGIFHLSDGRIEPLFDGLVYNNATPPPTWIGPGFR